MCLSDCVNCPDKAAPQLHAYHELHTNTCKVRSQVPLRVPAAGQEMSLNTGNTKINSRQLAAAYRKATFFRAAQQDQAPRPAGPLLNGV